MAGRRWLFLPLLCGTCLSEITQPPGHSGAQGSDATIPCAHDVADGIYDSIYWYRREAGRKLTYVAHSYRGEQKSGRFEVYVDRANRSSLLTIRALEPGDRAVYYCALQGTALPLHWPALQELPVKETRSRDSGEDSEVGVSGTTLSCLPPGLTPSPATWAARGKPGPGSFESGRREEPSSPAEGKAPISGARRAPLRRFTHHRAARNTRGGSACPRCLWSLPLL